MSPDSTPPLTLILPTYNAGEQLRGAVDSFVELQQQAHFECRLMVVDDGSSAEHIRAMEAIVRTVPEIVVLKNRENSGPGIARNRALDRIHSGYIGFIDSDDRLIAEHYVSAFLRGVESEAEWITYNSNLISAGDVAQRYDFQRLTSDAHERIRGCVKGEYDGSVIFSIYSAELIQRHQLRFPTGLYEDIPFAYAAMLLAERRSIYPHPAYQKMNRTGSIVNTISERHIDGLLSGCVAVRELVVDHGWSGYEAFEEDFSYGVNGYIETLIASVVRAPSAIERKIALLDYLATRVRHHPLLSRLKRRRVTRKDRVVCIFLDHWSTPGWMGQAGFIDSLKNGDDDFIGG